jgi:hypothetical protein
MKILRNAAWVLNKLDEVENLSVMIERTEETLNRDFWSDDSNCYFDGIVGERELLEIPWIYNHLPLFSNSVPSDKIAEILPALFDESKYMTKYGLTLVPRDSCFFRQDGYPNGSAWPPLQYFFWKAAYNIGEMGLARGLSEKWLDVFEKNHEETLCCWEEFRCDSGKGAGNSRFSGFQTPVIAVWASRRKFGRLECSQDVVVSDLSVSPSGKNASFVLVAPFHTGKSGVSIVLSPNSSYRLDLGGLGGYELNSDDRGYMDFIVDSLGKEKLVIELNKVDL